MRAVPRKRYDDLFLLSFQSKMLGFQLALFLTVHWDDVSGFPISNALMRK